jgi:hypothetical protein
VGPDALELDAMELDAMELDAMELDPMDLDTEKLDALEIYVGPEVLCQNFHVWAPLS